MASGKILQAYVLCVIINSTEEGRNVFRYLFLFVSLHNTHTHNSKLCKDFVIIFGGWGMMWSMQSAID